MSAHCGAPLQPRPYHVVDEPHPSKGGPVGMNSMDLDQVNEHAWWRATPTSTMLVCIDIYPGPDYILGHCSQQSGLDLHSCDTAVCIRAEFYTISRGIRVSDRPTAAAHTG